MIKNFWILFCVFTVGFGFLDSHTYATNSVPGRFTLTPTVAPGEGELATAESELATEAAETSSPSAEELLRLAAIRKEDITKPEEIEEKGEYFELFARRPVENLNWRNFIAYTVQYAVQIGVPANTVILILLLPMLASLVALVRHIIGLPNLGILVTVSLSITLVATGITVGAMLLTVILISSIVARIILKKVHIMQLPKMALSIFVVTFFIFGTLVAGASVGVLTVRQLSIFPVLLLILLSERIVALQLERSLQETVLISATTMGLGLLGYMILSSTVIRDTILLYPELIFLLIPVNIAIGRYFGLRLTEFFRFHSLLEQDNAR